MAADPTTPSGGELVPPTTMTSSPQGHAAPAFLHSLLSTTSNETAAAAAIASTIHPDTPGTTNTTTIATNGSSPSDSHIVISVVVSLVGLIMIIIALLIILNKLGKLPTFFYRTHRKRRSSTSSSRRALEEETGEGEADCGHRPNEKLKKTTEEMFTIEDFEEEDEEGEGKERDEYYYDEVFGQSEFEDETTKNAVRQLYARDSVDSNAEAADGGEEMLDFDFETLGIKADDYSLQAGRNVTV